MNFRKFLLAELFYRKKGIAANALVVAISIATITFLVTTSRASLRSIQLITKSMGHNLIMIHEDTKPEDYYTASGNEVLFPFSWIDTLVKFGNIVTTYHVAVLQKRDTVNNVSMILTGALPIKGVKDASPSDKKNPFVELPVSSVRLGSEVAYELKKKKGDSLVIHDKSFFVERVEPEIGTADDYRVYISFNEMEKITGLDGMANAVFAMECLCEGEPLSVTEARIRQTIRKILPNMKIMTLGKIAMARYEARETTDKYNKLIIALLLAASVAFIIIHSWTEARHREKESALLSALGYPSSLTVRLYFVKSLVISIIPSVAGFFAGLFAAFRLGTEFAKAKIIADYTLLPILVSVSIVVCIIAFLPALKRSLSSDPVDLLREE